MIASKQIKGLLAGAAAVALIGTAMAQGSPPNPAIKSAPVGAGQQSSQGTPMGDTGTPTGGSAVGSTRSSTNMGSTSNSTNMGSTSGSGTSMGSSSTSADTSMAPMSGARKRTKRMARADRN